MDSIRPLLNKISPSFCAAKWLQVTVHLQNGNTHSCHHPKTHKVPIKELKANPSALHNTELKKKVRQEMLNGKRPSECSYCWKVEDLPGEQMSDRYVKSSDPWAKPYLDKIKEMPWDANVEPTYLEVSFSNICNFKCAYCLPQISSKWMSEIKEHGPYPTSQASGNLMFVKKSGFYPLPDNNNPYVDAFWKWLPDVIKNLHELRVTGGEPLLSKDALNLLDFLITHPSPKMTLNINSNLGVPTSLIEKVIPQMNHLRETNSVGRIKIFTSIDTWGKQAEYIRAGLDIDLWQRNVDLCLEKMPQVDITVMVTFNALSVFRFKEFLEYSLTQKKKYPYRFFVDISILHDPHFLNLLVLNSRHQKYIESCYEFMIQNRQSGDEAGFYDIEINKMKRTMEYSKVKLKPKELQVRQSDFVAFHEEYDRRKNKSFLETFPEMKEDFLMWKSRGEFRRKKLKARTWVLKHIEKIFIK